MTLNNHAPKSNSARLNNFPRLIKIPSSGFFLRAIAIVILAGLGVSSFYSSSSASQLKPTNKNRVSEVVQNALPSPPRTLSMDGRILPVSKVAFSPVLLPLPTGGETIETFAAGCTTPKSSFAVGDIICVKVTGFPTDSLFPRRLLLGNANSTIIKSFDITTDPQTFQFTIDATSVIGGVTVDNRGLWQAVVFNPFFYYPEASTTFTVADPVNLTADLGVATTLSPGDVQAGTAITFELQLKNYGPDSAATVALTDAIPANTTFVDFQQTGGPTFTCTNPDLGASSGSTICTISSLVWPGPAATFVATYEVIPGTPLNTAIVNTVDITSTTNDQNVLNNTTSDTATVVSPAGTACSFDCPENMTVTATGPSGAVVTFASAINVDGDCGAISASPSSGSQFPIGTTTVNVASGSGPSCSFTVTVVNTPAPTISCPVDKVVTDSDNSGFENVAVGAPTTTPSSGVTVVGRRSDDIPATYDDDGNVVTPEIIVPLTDPYPIGTTGVTWTVTDSVGRKASCTQRIVVVAGDSRPAVTITCPANVTATAPDGFCEATISAATIGTPTTNPSDSDVVKSAQRGDGQALSDPFPAGTTTITWTAHDNITNTSASCVQTVTVTVSSSDTTPPTFVAPLPPNLSVTTSTCTATLDDELGTAEATDGGACGGSVTITRTGVPANFVFPTGTTTVTYTATDASGNTATHLQTVTVTESPAIPPTITAPADVSVNTGPGATSCGAVVSDATLGTATANDNCPGVTVVRTGVPAGNNFPVGNTTVTYTATDASGNTATDTQIVTVVDNTVPTITAPADSSANADANCQAPVPDYRPSTTAGDNCGSVTLSQSPAPGTLVGFGPHTVTITATDSHNNTNSDDVVFTVNDVTPPTITAPADSSAFADSVCLSPVPDYRPGTVAADNCGNVTLSQSPAPGTLVGYGPHTITVTANDGHGNTASDTVVFTVNDNTPPVFTSCPTSSTIEPTCPTGAIATYPTPTATDNCGATVTRTAGPASGSVFPIGTTTVTHVADDGHGNTATCTFTVTVLTPQAVIQNLINSVNASSLTGTQKNGLLAKLNAALTAINGGGGNACAKLSDFVNSVGTLISHGDITAAQGNAWISSANHVRNTIGCTNLGCS